MCNLIRRALDQNGKRKTDDVLAKSLAPRQVVLYGISALEDEESHSVGSPSEPLMLIGIKVHIPMSYCDDDFDIVRLSLFAESGMSLLFTMPSRS